MLSQSIIPLDESVMMMIILMRMIIRMMMRMIFDNSNEDDDNDLQVMGRCEGGRPRSNNRSR